MIGGYRGRIRQWTGGPYTDADYLRLVEKVDKPMRRGGSRKKGISMPSEKLTITSAITANTLGVSRTRVENARAVMNSWGTGIKQKVLAGNLSLNMAAKMARNEEEA